MVGHAENNQAFQRSYDNLLFARDVFYVHPCFERSGVRVDQFTARPDLSQAAMYRAMLRLPVDASLTLPRLPPVAPRRNSVLLIPESTSWPNTQPKFWARLAEILAKVGRDVIVNDRAWPLSALFRQCAAAEWVIGPQCGVMSILATGRFPCRKTFATPSMDDNAYVDQWADHTYPYAYVTKFAGEDHDVEEIKITDVNHADVIAAIANGVNGQRLRPHDPAPVTSIWMPLTPGDFLDRLAVLTVKRSRFDPMRRAAVDREYRRYVEAARRLGTLPQAAQTAYKRLRAVHELAFTALDGLVPGALNGGADAEAHSAAIRFNAERVELKNEIDRAMHAPYLEVKRYGNDDHS